MLTASQLLASRMGIACAGPHRCAVCGGLGADVPIGDVCGSLTTDAPSFRAPHSDYVCAGCALVRGRSAHPIGRESGWFCNFSHFVDADRSENASKGEKPRILAWLRRPKRGPWFCAIADTGQKHLVCYAPINLGGRGRVRFEEADVALPDEAGWGIVADLAALLTMGATKEEIESGNYGARAWQLCGDALATFERDHGGKRGGGWFALALWLAQRDEQQVAVRIEAEKEAKKNAKAGRGRKGTAAHVARGDAVGATPCVSPDAGSEDAGALARLTRPDAGSGAVEQERGRVGDADGAVAPDPATGQLGLFDAARPEPLRARARGVAGDAALARPRARAARGARAKDGGRT